MSSNLIVSLVELINEGSLTNHDIRGCSFTLEDICIVKRPFDDPHVRIRRRDNLAFLRATDEGGVSVVKMLIMELCEDIATDESCCACTAESRG